VSPSSPSSCCYGNILLTLHHKVLEISFINSNELDTLTLCGDSLSSLWVGTTQDASTLSAITKIMNQMSVIMNTSTMSIRCQSFENFISCRRYVHNVQHYYNSCEGQHSFLNAYNIFNPIQRWRCRLQVKTPSEYTYSLFWAWLSRLLGKLLLL